MGPERKLAQCSFEFEDEERERFCPIAQSEAPLDLSICDVCIKVNTRKGSEDLPLSEFLRLHPELNHPQAVKLLLDHLDKNPPNVDPTPLRSCHQRLTALPDSYKEQILTELGE